MLDLHGTWELLECYNNFLDENMEKNYMNMMNIIWQNIADVAELQIEEKVAEEECAEEEQLAKERGRRAEVIIASLETFLCF